MIRAEIPVEPLNQLQKMLEAYQLATGKSVDEVLEKKGRDLGIRLYQGFRDRKWGGPGKSPRLARAELAARTAQGRGTVVRSSLRQQYLEQRASLRAQLRSFIGPKNSKQKLRDIKRAVSLWQKFVGREIGLRQSGIGALAAAFLWYRSRTSQARGKYYVRNRTRAPIGYVEKGDGFLRIIGLVAGLTDVDARYGIVRTAITGAIEDMQVYLLRKQKENFQKAFGGRAA